MTNMMYACKIILLSQTSKMFISTAGPMVPWFGPVALLVVVVQKRNVIQDSLCCEIYFKLFL